MVAPTGCANGGHRVRTLVGWCRISFRAAYSNDVHLLVAYLSHQLASSHADASQREKKTCTVSQDAVLARNYRPAPTVS